MVKVIYEVGNALYMAVHIFILTMPFHYSVLEGLGAPIIGTSNFIKNSNCWIKSGIVSSS